MQPPGKKAGKEAINILINIIGYLKQNKDIYQVGIKIA
jgi:hypothetical protein